MNSQEFREAAHKAVDQSEFPDAFHHCCRRGITAGKADVVTLLYSHRLL